MVLKNLQLVESDWLWLKRKTAFPCGLVQENRNSCVKTHAQRFEQTGGVIL